MRIAVVAANGRTGQAFVEAALAAGHTVRGGVHGQSHLQAHPRLEILSCDATNEQDLRTLIEGQEAVVSFIGHVKGSAPQVQTIAIKQIIAVMKQQRITRLVSLTGTGVRLPGDRISIIDRILNLAIQVIDPARVKDGKDHAIALQHSGLDWTLIRVLKLQNTAPQPFVLREHGPTKWYVGRQEVAQAVLQVLETGSHTHQAPIIAAA